MCLQQRVPEDSEGGGGAAGSGWAGPAAAQAPRGSRRRRWESPEGSLGEGAGQGAWLQEGDQ